MTKVKSEKSELKCTCTWIKLEREGVKLSCEEKG